MNKISEKIKIYIDQLMLNMTIYFFFNSSGINIVWISTTHAITAMKKIGAHDIPIDNINHPGGS